MNRFAMNFNGAFSLRCPILVLSILAGSLSLAPANADTILESATLGPSEFGGGLAIGGSVNNPILGNRFSVSATTQITAIGGHLNTFDDGNLFNIGSIWGAIIPMSGFLPAFDASEIEAIALVHAIFEDDNSSSGDLREPVSLVLNPGDYALLFGGGGLFGTTGEAHMSTTNQVRLPGFSVFYWDGRPGNNVWRDGGTDQAPRFVVEGFATNAETVTYSWTGTIVSVEVDDGTGIYTGTQVGDTFSGTFTYDPDVANIDVCTLPMEIPSLSLAIYM